MFGIPAKSFCDVLNVGSKFTSIFSTVMSKLARAMEKRPMRSELLIKWSLPVRSILLLSSDSIGFRWFSSI
jgi:hypothetical protein